MTPRIGIDLGGTKIEGVAIDAAGGLVARERVATPRDRYDETLGAIAALVARLEGAVGARGSVGVGMPGAVSPATGLIKNANSTWLNGRRFGADLGTALGRPVRVANDADCFALSEATDGAAAGAATVFGVILGTGTGGGVVVHQRLLAGPNAVAGEWGHNPLPWPRDDERPGPACYCGRAGCIETFLAGPAIAREYAAQMASGSAATEAAPDAAAIAARAGAGEALAEAIMQRLEDRLARGLASIINVLDPHVIVLGGGLSNLARLYTSVPTYWPDLVFGDRHVATRLVQAAHGDSSGVRGAAWLWTAAEAAAAAS
jgi:fructokinase